MTHSTAHHTSDWETIIGLEVHVQLNTKSKLFSKAPNRFGDEPNTNITEVCTGQPGALPVLNKEAVRKAVQFGLSINAHVAPFSKFDRKSYFYPDSPRNFQITQFDKPIIIGGTITADVEGVSKTFAVNRAHLEDDAGMLQHFSKAAGVDYNRAGAPLLEIVSEPVIRSGKEATAYVMAIKTIMEYLDASDTKMEEGSLRIDTNISVRKKGEEGFRNKIEIKNMNSFTNMEMAVEAEVKRQIREYTQNPTKDHKEVISQATYRWDPEKKEAVMMRRKEDADDYRYFPEPDLVPIILSKDYIESVRKHLPELPYERKKRYINELKLTEHSAGLLTEVKALADYFEESLHICGNARSLCNWITVEFAGRLKDTGKNLRDIGITSHNIAKLVTLIDTGVITGKIAKAVADEMILNPTKDCEAIINENPAHKALHDTGAIEQHVDEVLAANAKSVADFKAGKAAALGFLVGQVMKLSKGTANPDTVNKLLKAKLDA